MKLFFLLVLLVCDIFAFDISSSTVANGKTVLIEFDKQKDTLYKDIVFNKKRYKIFLNPVDKTKSYVLVPISYYQKPSKKIVKIEYLQNGKKRYKRVFIGVKEGNYKKEKIKVNKSKVNPRSKDVKKRISKEYNEAMRIYNHITKKSYIDSDFILPIDSNITSAFGTARIYNGSLKGYHSGTDFRAKMGTPIVASNDGVVALVKKRFYSGGTVIIDHGEGIYTCYFHMSKFNVKKSQFVKKGEVLGLSGKSGRVTGPHLHFSARVYGVQVDPLELISLLNNRLLKDKK